MCVLAIKGLNVDFINMEFIVNAVDNVPVCGMCQLLERNNHHHINSYLVDT